MLVIDLKTILSASIRLVLDSGLVKESDLFSLDGSKIEGRCLSVYDQEEEKMEAKESDILKQVDTFLKKWEETDTAEDVLEESEKSE